MQVVPICIVACLLVVSLSGIKVYKQGECDSLNRVKYTTIDSTRAKCLCIRSYNGNKVWMCKLVGPGCKYGSRYYQLDETWDVIYFGVPTRCKCVENSPTYQYVKCIRDCGGNRHEIHIKNKLHLDQDLVQKYEKFYRKDETFNQKDETFNQKDETFNQKDETFNQKDETFNQKDETFNQKDETFNQKDEKKCRCVERADGFAWKCT